MLSQAPSRLTPHCHLPLLLLPGGQDGPDRPARRKDRRTGKTTAKCRRTEEEAGACLCCPFSLTDKTQSTRGAGLRMSAALIRFFNRILGRAGGKITGAPGQSPSLPVHKARPTRQTPASTQASARALSKLPTPLSPEAHLPPHRAQRPKHPTTTARRSPSTNAPAGLTLVRPLMT